MESLFTYTVVFCVLPHTRLMEANGEQNIFPMKRPFSFCQNFQGPFHWKEWVLLQLHRKTWELNVSNRSWGCASPVSHKVWIWCLTSVL
uniref:Uncharacterized protein n=1 Tax=Pyxicephalus adspersus TaxID=30357 RepID=A0AAV3A518_PYXAD|nr:TPA: hypothetical protein GDO54_010426 [Pyxicephalus adspersus]